MFHKFYLIYTQQKFCDTDLRDLQHTLTNVFLIVYTWKLIKLIVFEHTMNKNRSTKVLFLQ